MATPTTPPTPMTLTVLGCGTMGIAILSGILDSLHNPQAPKTPTSGSSNDIVLNTGASIGTSTAGEGSSTAVLPERLPSRFIACVKRHDSAVRVEKALSRYGPCVQVYENDNVAGVSQGDVILLCCKPQMCRELLSQVRDHLRGKLLVSILAGVTIAQISSCLVPDGIPTSEVHNHGVRIMRVMPNTASKIREGMTVISPCSYSTSTEDKVLVTWIFAQLGRTLLLPEQHMNACTALCGSGPAFYALILEAMTDGGVMMGLPRPEAQMMAAQTMQGAARLVLGGEHPAIIREQVSTPAGCTIGGLLVLEDGKVRSTIARGIQEATRVASGLGSK